MDILKKLDLEQFPSIREIKDRLKDPDMVGKIRGIGDILRYGIVVVALVVAYFYVPQLVLPLIYSVLATQLVISIMKIIGNGFSWGMRPDGGDSGFPSGHVGGAFSGAWFFYFAFGPYYAAFPLALGALTMLSRVLPKKHSWFQTIVGALVAYGVAAHFLVL